MSLTKKQLFKKYSINESHAEWDQKIDNWISIEVFRIMHNGKLPEYNDMSVDWVTKFLDKLKNDKAFLVKLKNERDDFGSLYLTSKRMVYRFADQLIKDEQTN